MPGQRSSAYVTAALLLPLLCHTAAPADRNATASSPAITAETLASVQSALGTGAHLLDARAQPAQAPAQAAAPEAMPSAPGAGAAQAASQPVGAPAAAPAAAASPGQAGLRGIAGPAHAPAPAAQPARAEQAAPPAPPPVAPSPPPPPTAFATPAPPNAPLPDRPTFWWGTATAAFQVEGYVTADGRGVSIWDTFGATPGKTHNGDTGATADEFYRRYPADIRLMRSLGVRHFRMSIAWPRVLPQGAGPVNAAGLAFYLGLVEALQAAGIQPYVTLYHWDLPQALQDSYGGWNSSRIVDDFAEYAATVFAALGQRVTYWTTFNEPWSFCFLGNANGQHAPGLQDRAVAWNCVYHVLLAHAAAVKRFRALVPGGQISMNINCDWAEPRTSSAADQEAAQRKLEFQAGIFGDPLYFGEWPASVRARVPYLPVITPQQGADMKGTLDYFALNHYTSLYVRDAPGYYGLEARSDLSASANGPQGLIGAQADSDWLYRVPWGLRKMLRWVHERYRPADIYVTENGCDVPGEDKIPLPDVLDDTFRVDFYRGYVQAAQEAVTYDAVPLRGYFAWSLLGARPPPGRAGLPHYNYEWADGYAKRFGIVYVNYTTQQRYIKRSARVLANMFGTV